MDKQKARRRQALRAAADQAKREQEAPGALDQLDTEDPFEDEEAAAQRLQEAEHKQAKLDALAAALAKKRQSAVEGRAGSGIEDIWREDEEFYEGIDDANRHENVHTVKPRDLNGRGGASIKEEATVGTGSTIFANITRPYVDFSAGRAADMLLPTDDRNWDISSTIVPDIIGAFTDDRPLQLQNAAPGAPTTIGQAARMMAQEAGAKVDKARKRIEDWHSEAQYHAEQRKIIQDAARVGVSILKGPTPRKSVSRAVVKDEAGNLTMKLQNKLAPVSKAIDHWNFFPDASCGDDIHNGNFVWERDRITARQLRDLLGTVDTEGNPMYLEDTIKLCLAEGAQRKFDSSHHYQAPDAEQFEIWYYHGVASAEDLAAAGVTVEEGSVVPVVITMVNDRVIKAARSTLDAGGFPYDVMVWQARKDHWAGIGVARQVRTAQRILNGAWRNMMDNAGLAAGPQIIIMDGIVKPLGKDDDYNLRPRKMWKLIADAKVDDVSKAMASVVIPMMTAELMSIVQAALKMAEDVTGLPMLLQGQQGQATDTVGGMTILTNNSNTPLRAIAKQYDDRITTPHLTRYYEWLLLYGADDEKGEFKIVARGSGALFERDAQNQAILAMAPLIHDPAFKLDPAKWIVEALKAQRLDPARFQYTPEEWAKLLEAQKNAPPPADPRIEAANIAAKAAMEREQLKAQTAEKKIAADTDREGIFQEGQQRELDMRLQLAQLEYASKHQLTLEQVKSQLAQTAMKLQAQERLSLATAGGKGASPQVSAPPTEPAGRAEKGEAYQA